MSTTSPTPLSYDVFVSDGPARGDRGPVAVASARVWGVVVQLAWRSVWSAGRGWVWGVLSRNPGE
jgi:hypothetical protein